MSINCRDYPPMPGGANWPNVTAPADDEFRARLEQIRLDGLRNRAVLQHANEEEKS